MKEYIENHTLFFPIIFGLVKFQLFLLITNLKTLILN